MNLRRLFGYPQIETGAILDTVEAIEQAPRHELFCGGEPTTPPDWKKYLPKFRNQGSSWWCTAFANTDIASAFEKKETGKSILFSPYELFYRTGGQLFGNTLLNAANGICESVVPEEYKPTPVPNTWGQAVYDKYKAEAKVSDWILEQGKKYRAKSRAVVNTDPESLIAALSVSPLSIAIPISKGYWDKVAPKTGKKVSIHNVVLTGVTDKGWEIKDSLQGYPNFDGYHILAPDYEILFAVSFIDLPDDWQGIQAQAKQDEFKGALEHYGRRRSMRAEIDASIILTRALEINYSLKGVMGKEWTIAINAFAYGGYTLQDLLNHYTSIKRGKGKIFDLNKVKP
ncbi:MAG: hypothetical protein WC551_02545 [Patescibacteria group bacterium]